MNFKYCNSFVKYSRFATHEVSVGNRPLGANNVVRIQSMTNTSTNDIDATVEQCIAIIDAGADYVRITAPGVREAEALRQIKAQLVARGYDNPLVADIHFNPQAAIVAAAYAEKVRINPGNYVDKRNIGKLDFTDEEYNAELQKIQENLKPLLDVCRQHGTAIRIGVNHGSLSSRIMSRYGDTPMGMVMSMMEFLRICKAEKFDNIVLSLKSSNMIVMVQSCRLLVAMMKQENMNYPLHLGVTEAGDGDAARIKSAAGIGALLLDGIGDTVRVSLTEAPEAEIPVAKQIVDYCLSKSVTESISEISSPINPFEYSRRSTCSVRNFGGNNQVATVVDRSNYNSNYAKPDFIITPIYDELLINIASEIIPVISWGNRPNTYPLFSLADFVRTSIKSDELNFVQLTTDELRENIGQIALLQNAVLLLSSTKSNQAFDVRAAIFELINKGIALPVVPSFSYDSLSDELFRIHSACDCGLLCIDGLVDGIMIQNENMQLHFDVVNVELNILQASRLRFSTAEFIACPSCGRTLYDIQSTLTEIKSRLGHLNKLKIGVMGCIVNGPGEMADADYGYVGAGVGNVSLYKGKTLVKKNIPASTAIEQLINLIKENGDWVEA